MKFGFPNTVFHRSPADAAVENAHLPLLGPPADSRAYSIRVWLSGTEHLWQSDEAVDKVSSVLHAIPIEDIWRWVDEDSERRAWYFATFVPKDLLRYPEKRSLVRELLVR